MQKKPSSVVQPAKIVVSFCSLGQWPLASRLNFSPLVLFPHLSPLFQSLLSMHWTLPNCHSLSTSTSSLWLFHLIFLPSVSPSNTPPVLVTCPLILGTLAASLLSRFVFLQIPLLYPSLPQSIWPQLKSGYRDATAFTHPGSPLTLSV